MVQGKIIVGQVIASRDKKWAEYFSKKVDALIKMKSIEHVGSSARYLDVVRDVINLLPLHWIAEEIVSLPEFFFGSWMVDGLVI